MIHLITAIIFAKNEEKHLRVLFNELKNGKATLDPNKCKLCWIESENLWCSVSMGIFKSSRNELEALKSFKKRVNVRESSLFFRMIKATPPFKMLEGEGKKSITKMIWTKELEDVF